MSEQLHMLHNCQKWETSVIVPQSINWQFKKPYAPYLSLLHLSSFFILAQDIMLFTIISVADLSLEILNHFLNSWSLISGRGRQMQFYISSQESSILQLKW